MVAQIIKRDELKAKLDRGDSFQLGMAMDEWHYEACRIPGSILLTNKRDAGKVLRKDGEIVLYCSTTRALRAARWRISSNAPGIKASATTPADFTTGWRLDTRSKGR